MIKLAAKDYNEMVANAKESLKVVLSNFWDVSKLDVELDNTTYFYEVKESRIYLDAEKAIEILNLTLDEFDFIEFYYDILENKIIIQTLDDEIDNLIKEYISSLLITKK